MQKELVERLEEGLRSTEPELWSRLSAGASESQVLAVEQRLGQALPESLAALYRWRNGQRGKGTFPTGVAALGRGFLFDLDRALATRETLLTTTRPAGAWPGNAWPVLDGGDGDRLAVDLVTGKVLWVGHEAPRPAEVAGSVEAWVESLVDALVAPPTTHGATLPPVVEPAESWNALRTWLRQGRGTGSTALFARVALASETVSVVDPKTSEQAVGEHPVMATLRQAVEGWLAEPGPEATASLRQALATRRRSYVPRDQMVVAVQLAGEAALADSTDQACDFALQALAAADPSLVEGAGLDLAARCRALQARLLGSV